jgi:ATP-binding cassette subfamily B protein
MDTSPKLPKTLPAFFWHFIKKQWKGFAAMQFFNFGWSLDHTLFPIVMMMLVDTIIGFEGDRAEMWSALSLPLMLGAGIWVTVEIFYRLAGFIGARFFPKLEASIRMEMFDYAQKHSHVYFSNHLAGSIANKIADMPRSVTQILQLVTTLFFPVALALLIALFLFARINLLFALILATWLIVHVAICLIFARKCAYYSNIHAKALTTLAGKIVDTFSNHLNVKLFSRHAYEHKYLSNYQQDEQKKYAQSLYYIEKMKIALGLACFLGAGVAINWYMLYSWQQGNITTGEVVFIFNTTWNMVLMAWLAGLELPNLYKEIGVCKQALTVIQEAHDITNISTAAPLNVTRGEITFENVTFQYTPNHKLFQNKTITLEAGHKVGLVGLSGSGKTTFVHLILRYFDLEEGRILLDGQDISKVTQESLRSQISMIPQDTALFHRSLMENIRYGRLEATDDEVIEAAKKAHCHEFIEKMPQKYASMAGERGIKLSGGQRQRIAIARAILKNAPILILDEATSSLDSVTEKQIQDGLDILMEGKTSLVIAHRLSTLSGMDRILVFKDGEIVEDGTHAELIEAQSYYATMWNMQAGGFLPDDEEEYSEDDEEYLEE